MTVGHRQVAPAVAGRGGGGDMLAGEDSVHLARLRKSQHTAVVEMGGKVVLAGKPEALFDRKEVIFERHGASPCLARKRVAGEDVPGYPALAASWTRSTLSSRARHQRLRPAARARSTARLVGSETVTRRVAPARTAFSTIS